MSHKLKNRKLAAEVQPTTPEAAAVMHVAPSDASAEQPNQDAAPDQDAEQPDQDATPEQPSPLVVATDAAPAPLAPFTPELAPAPRSLEEILEVVKQAKGLTDRLTAYKATSEKLGSFELAKEGFTDRLTIKEGSGLEWNTTQSSIIQKVLDVLRGELRTAIDGTEAELRHLLPAA